jgi:hypothetical protein
MMRKIISSLILISAFLFVTQILKAQTTIFTDDFETDKGWTLTGEFERDAPIGLGGNFFGEPDPTSAVSGSNVLGVDLTGLGSYPGDYEPGLIDREYTAISPLINCSGYENVALNFQRWLNVEDDAFDHVYIDIWDGASWNQVWTNTTGIEDNAWTSVFIDISAYADDNNTMQIRFSAGVTDNDGDWQYSGWNIDDIEILGETFIWYEDFENSADGDVTGTGTPNNITSWTADGVDNHQGRGVNVQGNRLHGIRTSASGFTTWVIDDIDPIEISGYSDVSIIMDIYDDSDMKAADNVLVEYELDNSGTWLTFDTNGNPSGNFTYVEASQTGLSGVTLRLRITFTTDNNEDHYVDNIRVAGTFANSGSGTNYYSYQTGNWDDASTWTHDPGGSTQTATDIPHSGDNVIILNGRTVNLTDDVDSTNLYVTIIEGGIFDQVTYQFTSGLAVLKGSGTFKLASENYPTVTTNDFVNTDGGTTEYYNTSDFTLPSSQSTYYNLRINAPGVTATQLSNLNLNGDLHVKQGTFRINDNTSSTNKLNLTINGDVLVDNGAFWIVGQGSTNSTTDPTSVTGGTAPYLNYYEEFHRVAIYGDFTNNGTVKFTNLAYPLYDAFPPTGNGVTSGAASVYFSGTSNNVLNCNGTTDFYNLILDKGIDQTYSLTINPSQYYNFRLFGANIAPTTDASVANPDLMKALWIRTGTLILKGLTVIPSLTEGTVADAEYYIPSNGALTINGSDVIVLNTADDYEEVNVAYIVAGGTGSVNGVNTTGADYQGIVVYGGLKLNSGYFSARESAGILYNEVSAGEIELNGGVMDAKQFRTYSGTASGTAYRQTGGTFILRGRFVRPVAYASISDLSSTSGTLDARAVNGTEKAYGTFNLEDSDNIFSMTGGTIRVYDASGNFTGNNLQYAIDIVSSLANTSVTGGTFELLPQAGSVLSDASAMSIWFEESVCGNLTLNRGAGCATDVRIRNRDLTILNDLTLTSGDFELNNLNITIGGDLTVSTNGLYDSGTETTTFNGTQQQTFTIDGTIDNGAAGLSNLHIDRTTDTLKLAGIQISLTVQGIFDLDGGVFDDGGLTVNIAGNITNSGTHIGSGAIRLNGTLAQTIGGDGSGIFENLELNNTDAATAPVSLTVNTTINGNLTFSNDKLFDISSYNLRFNSDATVINAATNRFIQTNGESGDGGVTMVYSSATAITFPVGAASTSHATADYTPATIGFTSEPITLGSITVIPVGYEHPTTTIDGQSLTYFWRVKSEGFSGIVANSVTHSFQYSNNDVVGTVGNYIPTLYDRTNYSWVNGTNSNPPINTTTRTFTDWTSPGDSRNYLDADYTAGDNAFGSPVKYYSYQDGAWSTTTTWSLTDHTTNNPPATPPGANDIVIIGNGNTVNLTSDESCASLQIEAGAVLDIYTYTGGKFGMVLSHPDGNGLFRVTTPVAPSSADPQFFTFPSGDFSDFNVKEGTTEFYDIDGTAGALYILPFDVASYGNLILTAKGGDNLVFPNRSDLTIYGDLTCAGDATTAWIALSWSTNIDPYFVNDYLTVEKTVHVKGNLNVNTGTLIFMDDVEPQHLIVDGDITVASTGSIVANAPTDGYLNIAGVPQANTLSIGGSLYNNTNSAGGYTVDFQNTSTLGGATFDLIYYCDVTFFGANTASITNTSGTPTTVFNNVTINKGSSPSDSLICDIGGTLSTPDDDWLTLENGTFKYARSEPSSDFTISENTPFNIPTTAGLFIDYTSAANRNVLIANTNHPTQGDDSDVYLDGKLTVANGNVYIGRIDGAAERNNDIEYSGSGTSEIDIQGGNLMVNGQIRRNPAISGGVLKYSQSGGVVTVNGQNANISNAKLEVLNTGSVFNMSGGTITIVRGGGDNTYGDLYLRPHNSNVIGGEIIFDPSGVGDQDYILDATTSIWDLTINGSGGDDANVELLVSPLQVDGDLTLVTGTSILDANINFDIPVTINGNFDNSGIYTHRNNVTTFNGGAQQIIGSSSITFYDLTVSPVTSLTLNNGSDILVNHDLEITSGTLICGNYAINLKNNLINNSAYTDTQYGIILNGTSQQQISGSGTFARLELDNSNGALTGSDISLNKNLVLTNGVLNINDDLLSLGPNSEVTTATSFGTSNMIITNGVFSDQGISKIFGVIGASVNFTYPLGVSGKYTPVDLPINSTTQTGSIRINCVNDYHPAVIDQDSVLHYYWAVESSGLEGYSGNLVFNYLDGDVKGIETDYLAARIENNAWGFPGTVDDVNNTLTYNFSGVDELGDEYTAGISNAFPASIPVFTSIKNGNWDDPLTWTQTSGTPYALTNGPDGFIVIVEDTVTLNKNYCHAYRTTINGEIRKEEPFFGHNFGTVSGNGALYLENATIPAGKYGSFFSCSNNGTLEYGGTGDYTLVADLYDEVANLLFTGTGTRTLPNKDLTICTLLEIDGPTLNTNNGNLIVKGDMLLTAGAFNSGTGNETVTFAGSSEQNIDNFSGINNFNNLEIDNSAGLTLDGDIDVAGKLLLTNGLINTFDVNSLTITNTSEDCVIPEGGSSSSYVNGPLVKTFNQGNDYFLYPIGNSTSVGNMLSLKGTQTGTKNWTVSYENPSALNSYASPLTAVNEQEYWTVSTPSGGNAIVNIAWNSSSNLTPLMTQNGLSDMRVAEHDGSNWTELGTNITSGSDSYDGSAETDIQIPIDASGDNYTLACVNQPKPRIRFDNTNPVCGDEGISVLLSTSYTINGTYTIYYTVDGGAEQSVNPASFPYVLPTGVTGATYLLTGFEYDSGAKTGVVDITPFTTYTVPTTADAGTNQSICGGTSATLAANTPTTGSGQWSIASGSGGSFVAPTSPSSVFNGTNGSIYELVWTISNGECASSDTVVIAFPLLPVQPGAFTASSAIVCEGDENVEYTVTNDPSVTYTWDYSGTGEIITGTGNSIDIDFIVGTTDGIVSVYVTNGCGDSAPRTIDVTVNQRPDLTFTVNELLDTICHGATSEIELNFTAGVAPFVFTLTDGSNNYNLTTSDDPYTYTTEVLNWTDAVNPYSDYVFYISTITDDNGCTNTNLGSETISVFKIPETGPQYHIKND